VSEQPNALASRQSLLGHASRPGSSIDLAESKFACWRRGVAASSDISRAVAIGRALTDRSLP
jgi:hypothetical protein